MLQRTARAFLLFTMVFAALTAASAQTPAEIDALKEQAATLLNQDKYIEAVPVFEKLVKAEPDNPDAHFYLGFTILAQAKTTKDKDAARQLTVRARQSFVKAKQLGSTQKVLDAFIASLPEDGEMNNQFSKNTAADNFMQDGEAAFTQGKIDDALGFYQKALKLDPKLYEAALYSGDMYIRKDDFASAEIWYQKAIAIDPTRETAYRYSATPLMKQRKFDQARDRYIEAYITEPFNRLSAVGLSQWAEATKTNLAHPQIDIPTDVKFDEKGDAKITLDANSLLNAGKNDGSAGWLLYGATRSTWRKEKFAKTFPNEKTYRHSLPEEADAIRSVLSIADADAKKKNGAALSPALAKLKKLNDEGLLEAYILLARTDQGIAQDYAAYLAQNRDKLRRYMVDYVITAGGK